MPEPNASQFPPADPAYGALRSFHSRAPLWARFDAWMVVIGIAVGIVATIVPVQGGGNSGKFVGVVLIAAGLVGAVLIAKNMKRFALQYQHGVRIVDRQQVLFQALWTDVDYIEEQREGESEEEFCGITLHHKDGSTFRIFEDYRSFQQLKLAILEAVYGIITPETMAALQRGEFVDFDGLKTYGSGVEFEGNIIPWKQIQVEYESIYTIVRHTPTGKKIWQIPTVTIPNFSVLLEVFSAAGVEA